MKECVCRPGYTGPKCGLGGPAGSSTVVIAVSVVAAVLVLLAIILVIIFLKRRRSRKRNQSNNGHVEMASRPQPNDYIGVNDGNRLSGSAGSLLKAENFEPTGKEFPRELLHVMGQLGAGSFATVHKAEADGIRKKGIMETVAVKMLKSKYMKHAHSLCVPIKQGLTINKLCGMCSYIGYTKRLKACVMK